MTKTVNFYEVKDILNYTSVNIRMRTARMEEAENLPGNETFLGFINCIKNLQSKEIEDDTIIRIACNGIVCSLYYKEHIFEIIRFYDFRNEEIPSNVSMESRRGVIKCNNLNLQKEVFGINHAEEEFNGRIKKFYYSNVHPYGAFEYV